MQTTTERLNLAIEAAGMGMWDWDIPSDLIVWNTYQETLLGYAPGSTERTYRDWACRVHPADLPWVEAAIQAARDQRQQFSAEYRIVLPRGEIRWIESTGQFLYDAAGQAVRMVGLLRDVSDRKQAEQALLESEHRYAALAKLSPVGIFHTDSSGQCLYVNEQWCALAGMQPDEAMGYGWSQAIHPEDRERVATAWNAAVQSNIPFKLEYRFQRPDGRLTWVLGQAVLGLETTGVSGYVGTITDITDRKQAELSLQEHTRELSQVNRILARTAAVLKNRNQELDQFAYVASHDLKAPLRAIANLSEWIEEDLGGQLPPENQRQMHLLRGRVHRMEALIDGLLQYSRVGRTEAIAEPISPSALLNEILDSIEVPPGFTVAVPPELPTLNARRILLRQVLSNLITNAIKHHHRSNGQVKIDMSDLGDQYEFTVADDGPGIAPIYHDKIFVIFQTLEARDTKESTGIGLAIVKKIVEAEGGVIRVESEEGKGATFRFTWPVQPISE